MRDLLDLLALMLPDRPRCYCGHRAADHLGLILGLGGMRSLAPGVDTACMARVRISWRKRRVICLCDHYEHG